MRSTFKIVAFILICICVQTYTLGQELQVVPPTPNAMKMTEYYSQRPNMYTGTANVSIPLYTIDFDGWKLPLSISYNATGIRTNEEASEVGLGWALSATGIISRTVVGGDDLFEGTFVNRKKGYVYNERIVTFDLGWDDSHPHEVWEGPPDTSYYKHLVAPAPDTQPDIFNLNFFGHSGSFVLSQKVARADGKILVVKVTESALNIEFHEPTKTFIVKTPDGYKGEFTVKEKSTTFSSTTSGGQINRIVCCQESNIDFQEFENYSGKLRTTTSWYLSKITSPRGEVITFSYDYLKENGDSKYLSNTRGFGELEGIVSPQVCIQTIQEHVYLKKILSDEVQVDFFMEDREDLRKNYLFTPDSSVTVEFPSSENLKRYNAINIKSTDTLSTLNKSIIFKQRYFNQQYHSLIANTETELRWLRSRLDKVTIDDQEYRFYYEKGTAGLPNKMTNGIDHFGFYNGQDNTVLLLPPGPADNGNFMSGSSDWADTAHVDYYKQQWNRRVDFNYGKAGLLSKVKYPTRGYTVFEFEPHAYIPDTINYIFRESLNNTAIEGGIPAGGARVKSVREYDFNDNLQLSKSYKYIQIPEVIPPASPSLSTGKLMTPLYNRYTHIGWGPQVNESFYFRYKSHSSIPGNNTAEGKIVGYSRVHEIVSGTNSNYKNTYYFENRPNEVLINNSIAIGFPNLNGQVTEIRNYDSNGKVVQQTLNQNYHHVLDSIKAITYENRDPVGGSHPFLEYTARYTIKVSFNTPYTVITTVAESPSSVAATPDESVTFGNAIQTVNKVEYNNFLLKTEKTADSKGDTITTEYKRPLDYSSSTPVNFMTGINMVDPVIEQITYRNGNVIAATASRYLIEDNRVNLRTTYSYNRSLGAFASSVDAVTFPSTYEKKNEFTLYDSQSGKLLEYTTADGITNSFIWGYNKTLPIVKATGIAYEMLLPAYNATVGSGNYEEAIRNHANTSSAHISTFTHIPLVGISTAINPSKLKTTYDYDNFSRLKKIRDNYGNTLEQYQYNFKQLPPTRILELSGNLEFGTFYSCKKPGPKTLTIANNGEEELHISNFWMPGFDFSWTNGEIAPGTSVDVVVTFVGTTTGTYGGIITITSDQTNLENGPASFAISANYIVAGSQKTIQLSTDALAFESAHSPKTVVVSNVGNSCITITDVTKQSTDQWSASIVPLPALLAPGESVNLNIMKLAQPTPEPIYITVVSDKTAGNNVVEVGEPRRVVAIDLTSLEFLNFTEPSLSREIKVKNNNGNTTLHVDGGTTPAGFTFTPTEFDLERNQEQIVTVTFAPSNFSLHSGTITLNSDKTDGVNTISVSGDRMETRTLQLSPQSLVFDPPLFTNKTVTITNSSTSNTSMFITGVDNPNTNDWNATINNLPVTLAPGQSTSMSVIQKTPAAANENISVLSNKLSGNEVVSVAANKRIIGVSPTSYAFPSFTDPSISHTIYVTASGNTPLTVNSVSSTNAMFTASPTSFTVPVGQQQAVTITFTPPAFNFAAQSGTITFNSDMTSGVSSISLSGERLEVRTLQLSPQSLVFDPPLFTNKTVTITNSGASNDYMYITGVNNPNANDWDATISNLPVTLAPGQSTSMSVMQKTPDAANENISVVSNKMSGNEVVQVVANKRIIGVSPTSYTFPSFTDPSISHTIYVTASGNTPVTVNSVSSTNAMFNASPTSFTVPVGQQQAVTITFTPAAFNFAAQSGTITFNSDMTSGISSISLSGERLEVRTLQLSPQSLVFDPPLFTNKTVTVTNSSSSNDYMYITGVNYSNTNDWFATISNLPVTLAPGQSTTMSVMQKTVDAANENISIVSNKVTGNEVVTVAANKRVIGVSPTSYAFPSFTDPSISHTIYVTASGNTPVTVNSVSSTNAMFTASPTSFTVPVGQQQAVTITFTPPAFNFAGQSGTITFNSDMTSGISSISLSGERLEVRTLQLTPQSLVFDPPLFVAKTVNITNSSSSNDYMYITGVNYSNTNDWFASINNPVTLAPGQSTSMSVMQKTPNAVNENISVVSNKMSGNEVVQVAANKRIISVSPSSHTFPSFTGTSTSGTMTIYNDGNLELNITSISSTNSRFTVSPSSLNVAAGSSQNVTVTYTPTDFTQQSSTITFNSNATSGSGTLSVTGQRTQLLQISVSPTSLWVKPMTPTPKTYVTNTGNDNITVYVTNSHPSEYNLSFMKGGLSTSAPFVLTPGQFLEITVTVPNSDYTGPNGTLTITNNGNSEVREVYLTKSTQ